jgi:hypothetical protein
MSRVGPGNEPRRNRIGFAAGRILLALFGLIASMGPAASEDTKDWITALAREPIHIEAWPGGRRSQSALCFMWKYGVMATAQTFARIWMGEIPISSMNRFATTPCIGAFHGSVGSSMSKRFP